MQRAVAELPRQPPTSRFQGLQLISFPATAVSPEGPDTSQLLSSPKEAAEEGCPRMTNGIRLLACRAAAGAGAAIYKGCCSQKANISPWPMGDLL